MDDLEVLTITVTSPQYAAMLDLRDRVLRRPIGLILSAHDQERDQVSQLLVAQLAGRVVACCILTAEEPGIIQLRAMAVEPELQGRGVGRAVVAFAEASARDARATQLRLDARVTAVGFYQALGYAAEGEPYIKVGIPHRLMRKDLKP